MNQMETNNMPLRRLRPEHWWQKEPDGPELSLPVVKRLEAAGIHTVQELIDAGPDRLLRVPDIGKVALEEIKEYLRALHGETE